MTCSICLLHLSVRVQVFVQILKRTVQNLNNHIDVGCENNDLTNDPCYRNDMNRGKSVLFIVSNNSVTSKHDEIHSKLIHFQQLREPHASACDIAESVNAVFSPLLLLSLARSFTSLTHNPYYILVRFIVQKTCFFCKLIKNEAYIVWLIYGSTIFIRLLPFTDFTTKAVSHKLQYIKLFKILCSTNVRFVFVLKCCPPCLISKTICVSIIASSCITQSNNTKPN
jgi:hypothetical protein